MKNTLARWDFCTHGEMVFSYHLFLVGCSMSPCRASPKEERGVRKKILVLPAVNTKCGPFFFFRRRVKKWASFVHPGAHTLGIASTQRMESANSALKQALRRSGTLVNVDQAIIGRVQDDTYKTIRWAFSLLSVSPVFFLLRRKLTSLGIVGPYTSIIRYTRYGSFY